MSDLLLYLDPILFAALPYVAFFTFFLVTIQRYRAQAFTYSSLSSQLLENQRHFWALVPFHYGILLVLAGHVAGLCIPQSVLAWNRHPLRLYVLEATGLALALLTLIGLVGIVIRRIATDKVRVVTSLVDWILYGLLLLQVGTGIFLAVFYPWGTSWYVSAAAPYLWSIVTLQPDIGFVAAAPWMVKLHVVGAFLLITVFPFTRLVHILVVPNPYLWRKPQVVRWYR